MPDGVLPALLCLAVERELIHDELVDLAQCAHLERRRLHGHTNTNSVMYYTGRNISLQKNLRSPQNSGMVGSIMCIGEKVFLVNAGYSKTGGGIVSPVGCEHSEKKKQKR